MRTGLHRDANLQILVDGFVGIVGARYVSVRLYRKYLDTFAIDRQLDLLRFRQALDVFIAVAGQSDLYLILAVQRESMEKINAASRPEWKTLEVILLCQVCRQHNNIAARRPDRASDRETADFLRRRKVLLEESW